MNRLFPICFVVIAGCGGALPTSDDRGTSTMPGSADDAAPAVRESTSSCRFLFPNGDEEFSFDADGLPTIRYANSDAAGQQYEERYLRDARGRIVGIDREMLEEAASGERAVLSSIRVTYADGPDGSVVATHEAEDEDTWIVRWTYDEDGRPSRREEESVGSPPRATTCRYDDHGRVIARGDYTYYYLHDAAPYPFAIGDLERPGRSRRVTHLPTVVRVSDADVPRYEDTETAERYVGACHAVLFEPCSPVFAPPPPGRSRRERSAPRQLAALPSPERVISEALGCRNPNIEDEDSCTSEIVHRLEATEPGELRGVAVVRLARGPQGFETHHLVFATADGWFAGPELADGPFDGNQTSGTLAFATSEARLTQLVTGDAQELVMRYSTETMDEDEDGVEHEITEEGFLLCLDIANIDQRCTRVPEHARDETEEGTTEGRARITFPGDGRLEVASPSGAHPRVPREAMEIDSLFQQ